MVTRIEFESVAQRRENHQMIREAAREINDNTELLQTLFVLENGKNKHSTHGFGHLEKNQPLESAITFAMGRDELEEHLSRLEDADVNEFDKGDSTYEHQLDAIATQLHQVADTIQENAVFDE